MALGSKVGSGWDSVFTGRNFPGRVKSEAGVVEGFRVGSLCAGRWKRTS
jgi:hypothetical protein